MLGVKTMKKLDRILFWYVRIVVPEIGKFISAILQFVHITSWHISVKITGSTLLTVKKSLKKRSRTTVITPNKVHISIIGGQQTPLRIEY